MSDPEGISPEVLRRFTHDVVSPLMSVVALAEVLLLEARNDDRLNEDLRRIHAAADEALGMVRALSAELKSRELDAGH
ncbi:MAG TPA: histidine kinase [Vicinamibacterales bacterium]|nr:histidine kinase [Vicinamibacterales bacterium]